MKEYTIQGRALKYGDNINTDFISPAPYVGLSDEIMFAHAMEGVDPDFSKRVKPGDIIVAGKNFGSGSSRETAPYVIQGNGVRLVIAEFFSRIFFRNAINIGLFVLTCSEAWRIGEGDELIADPIAGTVTNLTKNECYQCTEMPETIMELVRDGGLIPHLEKKLRQ